MNESPASGNEESKTTDDKRLWIGNLDPRINEYQLLKIMQKHGAIEKFDLLFHRSGPLTGQPRGYAFITYETKESANTAKNALHNALIGNRKITVTWAHSMCNQEEPEKRKPQIDIPALAGAKEAKKTSRETQIQAIEAKLRMMENASGDDFVINKTVATEIPVISQFQQKANEPTQNQNLNQRHSYLLFLITTLTARLIIGLFGFLIFFLIYEYLKCFPEENTHSSYLFINSSNT